VAHFRDLVREARSTIDGLTVTTDIIVGFPGETDAEWRAGLETIEAVGFGHVHAFTYSPREGTAAARQTGQVATEVKRERAQVLHELAARMKSAHLERFVGQTREVLWEAPVVAASSLTNAASRDDRDVSGDDGIATWSGYTDNYLRVETTTDAGRDLGNRIVSSRLNARKDDRLLARPVGAAVAHT
jgi:threonylcarbamoyladenosine tRNA methylthiotransferase MtaB